MTALPVSLRSRDGRVAGDPGWAGTRSRIFQIFQISDFELWISVFRYRIFGFQNFEFWIPDFELFPDFEFLVSRFWVFSFQILSFGFQIFDLGFFDFRI